MHRSKVVALSIAAATLFSAAPVQTAFAKTKGGTRNSQTAAKASDSKTDKESINALIDGIQTAVGTGDVKAMLELWTNDGHYTDDEGSEAIGKEALGKAFSDAFAENGKPQVKLSSAIRFPSNEIAVVEGTINRVVPGVTNGVPLNRYSLLVVKQNGKWLIASGIETPILKKTVSEAATNPLKPMEWIIGNWKAEKNGISMNFKAEWTAGKNFILSRYEVKKPGQPDSISTQIIGWDPCEQHPVSWHFDSTGSYGHGSWKQQANQWIVDASGVQRDGTVTSATNIITNVGNGFTWQSVDRSSNGAFLADTQALKVERVSK